MCGILAIFRSNLAEAELRKALIQSALKLRHRGPDWSGYKVRMHCVHWGDIGASQQALIHSSHPPNLSLLQPTPKVYGNNAIAHERLAIIDPDSGSQPLVSPDGHGMYTSSYASLKKSCLLIHPPTHPSLPTVVVAANGEIYNYKELYEELGGDAFYKPKTGSDCEVVRA